MNTPSRFVLIVGPLVLGVLVSSCGEAATSSLLPSAPSSTGSSSQSLALSTNTTWFLQSLTEAGLPEIAIADRSAFTLVLTDDGRVQARADCNRASAGYAVTDHTISVGLLASTMAQCASAPVDTQYLALLGGENVVTINAATLQLSSSRGTLRFVH